MNRSNQRIAHRKRSEADRSGKAARRDAGALSAAENENYEPDIKALKKMSEIFGVSVDYILCLTDTAAPADTPSETLVALSAPKGYDRLTEDETTREIEEIIAIYNKRKDS